MGELLQLYLPKPPATERAIVAIASGDQKRIAYREHEGAPGEAQAAVKRVLDGRSSLSDEFRPISEPATVAPIARTVPDEAAGVAGDSKEDKSAFLPNPEPTQIITGKKNSDGGNELRIDTVARGKPTADGAPGPVDIKKSKAKAKAMINKGEGVRIADAPKPRPTRAERAERYARQMLLMSGMAEHGNAISANLLEKSGLTGNRVIRDPSIFWKPASGKPPATSPPTNCVRRWTATSDCTT